MFLIMGIQNKSKATFHSNSLPCHACDGDRGFDVYDKYNYFHLFFLPVWTWGHDYSVQCKKCGSYYYIKEESQKKAENSNVEFTYWDLEPAANNQTTYTVNKCKSCGYSLDDDFDYCPKCGTKSDT